MLGADLGPGRAFADRLDSEDPLAGFRTRFDLPGAGTEAAIYLVGNSLGPLPTAARDAVDRQVNRWAERGVDGWFDGPDPWYGLDEQFLASLAGLVGAGPREVAVMNGLTVNLHLLLASFFRPSGRRRRILIERPCFPSDRFAVETHLRWHGLDPERDLLEVGPRDGGDLIDESDIEESLAAGGDEIALVLLGGVNFLTGQRLDMARIAIAARSCGAVVGFDLAHAVGNVELRLHDWDVDFAAWCHYKYVNAGPGAPAGIFVHERHASNPDIGRLGGWWGNDPATRFRMQLDPDFVPRADAAGWQLSTPSVLAMAPLGPALSLFEEAGMRRLRDKSARLTAYLEWLIDTQVGEAVHVMTPAEPERRGAQLSLRLTGQADRIQARLQESGVVGDYRQPDVLRLAPAPLYNTYGEMWRTSQALQAAVREGV
ncbi:MAG: kynureninase [Gemmatimonadetes bacterium]|nr:kynureninase [Gemmatimonadota bacterium]